MAVTAEEIYAAAIAVMDEEDCDDYRKRSVPILNSLIGRCYTVSEQYETGPHSFWQGVAALSEQVRGLDKTLCLSALPFGLAALLYLEEDPARSRSWWSVFLEQLELCKRSPGQIEAIGNVYGGLEHCGWGRW